MGYATLLNGSAIGLPILAYALVTLDNHHTETVRQFDRLVEDRPEVLECHRGTGGDSFTMKVAVRSVRHLESLIDRLTPFGTTSTSVVLSSPVKRRDLVPADGAEKPVGRE